MFWCNVDELQHSAYTTLPAMVCKCVVPRLKFLSCWWAEQVRNLTLHNHLSLVWHPQSKKMIHHAWDCLTDDSIQVWHRHSNSSEIFINWRSGWRISVLKVLCSPRVPWQMSVLVAPSQMNLGSGQTSWKHQKAWF